MVWFIFLLVGAAMFGYIIVVVFNQLLQVMFRIPAFVLQLPNRIVRTISSTCGAPKELKVARQLYEHYVYTNEKMPLYCANCRNMGILLSHVELRQLSGVSRKFRFLGEHQIYSFGGGDWVLFMGRCRICKFSTTVHRVPASFVPAHELQQFLSYKSLQDFGTPLPDAMLVRKSDHTAEKN